MDPSPFVKKDLDHSVEEWIVSRATDVARHARLTLMIYLQDPTEMRQSETMATEAIHSFFAYKSQLSRRQLTHTLRLGRTSLAIGLSFLGLTLAVSKVLDAFEANRFAGLIREGLIIGGWVAMWRPLEILLYDWWPIRNRRLIFDRLSRMDVAVAEIDTAGAKGPRAV